MERTLILGDRTVPAEEVDTAARRAAAGFAALGVGEGDAVAWMLRNDVPMFVATQAAGVLGAYPVAVNWHLTGEEVAYILRDSGAKALVVHADLYRAVRDALPSGIAAIAVPTPPEIAAAYRLEAGACSVPGDVPAWPDWLARHAPWDRPARPAPMTMMYTSGTTGHPKGVQRRPPTPEQLESMGRVTARIYGFRPGIRTAAVAPLYHAAPNNHALNAWRCAGSLIVLLPRFDAEGLLAAVERHRLTHLFLVPIMFVRLLRLPEAVRRRYDTSSLVHVVHAGAPCPVDVKRAMIEWWGPVLHEYYGSTETSAVTHADSADWLARPGTVGRAVGPARIRILDTEGREVPAGIEGEVYCRRTDMPDFAYRGDEKKRRNVERDGLITNGDVGYLDADGYLFLCDRRKDMVISGGVNIYPAEVEAVLLACPGVRDAAVFGIPDPEFGEAVAAAVETAAGAGPSEAEVRAFLAARLARYKVPKVIEFRPSLPREDTGKIRKGKLREPYWAGAGRRI